MEPSIENAKCGNCIHQAKNLDDAPAHCWDCVRTTSLVHFEPKTVGVLDKQVGGSHYKEAGNNMQPWEIARAWRLGTWRHGVLKYLLRAPQKNGIQDIEKAIHYLEYIKANYNELKEEGLL